VKGFRASGERIVASFEEDERGILTQLAEQLTELLATRSAVELDPALRRLLPDAYPDDMEASAEFRRFTADDLAGRKAANAAVVTETLAASIRNRRGLLKLSLDQQQAQAWMRSLNDLRLTIGARLELEDEGMPDDADPALVGLYHWLSFAQGTLIEAIDR
jgi:hypothetical protein